MLCNQQYIVQDVLTLNKFNTGSDHGARIFLNVLLERKNFGKLKEKQEQFQKLLSKRLIFNDNSHLAKLFMVIAKKLQGPSVCAGIENCLKSLKNVKRK